MVDLANNFSSPASIDDFETQLREAIRSTAIDCPRFPDFVNKLAEQKIGFVCHLTKSGRVTGISFDTAYAGVIKASSLGREFTWTGLQRKLGIEYVKIRDFEQLSLCANLGEKPTKINAKSSSLAANNDLLSGVARIEALENKILALLDAQQHVDLNKISADIELLTEQTPSNFQHVVTETRDELKRVDEAVKRIETLAVTLNHSEKHSEGESLYKPAEFKPLDTSNVDEALARNLSQIKGLCQSALTESNKVVQRAEASVTKIRQESFWLAFVAA